MGTGKYKVDTPEGEAANNHELWNKAWIAHSCLVRKTEKILGNEANGLRTTREEVNKKRKLDQISCGNELRKLNNELDQYAQDNAETVRGMWALEGQVDRLYRTALERGVKMEGLNLEAIGIMGPADDGFLPIPVENISEESSNGSTKR